MRHLLIFVLLVAITGCGGGVDEAPEGQSATLGGSAPAQPAAGGYFEGAVVETMNAGGYTYVLVDTGSEKHWAAGPQQAMEVGTHVKISTAMPMQGFHSKTLDRTFSQILFVNGIQPMDGKPDCSQQAKARSSPGKPMPFMFPGGSDPSGAAPAGHPTAGHPPTGGAHPPPSAGGSRQGRVLETMVSGGYRYARVDFCGTETWVAGPDVTVEVGQTITTDRGMAMDGFRSNTLNRTFERIDFVKQIQPGSGEPDCG